MNGFEQESIPTTRRLRLWVAAAAIAALFVAPAAASAAERYATPSPDLPADCSAGDPCSLQTAVESASNGDEVIVNEGTYDEGTNQLHPTVSSISIHGAAGQDRPLITFGAMGNLAGVWLSQSGPQDLRRLAIESGGTGPALVIVNSSGTAEQLLVKTATGTACELGTPAYTVRDSVCATSASGRAGITSVNFSNSDWTQTLRNVTTVGSGASGKGLTVSTDGTANTTIDARNVIAQGGSGATSKDVQAYNFESPTSTATIDFAHSNYDSTCEVVSLSPTLTCGDGGSGVSITDPGSGANQTAAPVFIDAEFHQAPESPTVNAGSADASTGVGDLDGDPRSLGAAMDIGADEFVPPPPPPDGDGDGTPDASDACPGEAGPASNGGCPVPAPPSDPGGGTETPPEGPIVEDTPKTPPTDQRAPETTIKRTKMRGDDATLRFVADEPDSSFLCGIDRKKLRPCTSPKRYRNLDEGKHKVLVVAIDAAGNRDATPARSKFEIGGSR